MNAETPYIETQALLAILNDDHDGLCELLDEMTERESAELARSADKLARAVRIYRWERGHHTSLST